MPRDSTDEITNPITTAVAEKHHSLVIGLRSLVDVARVVTPRRALSPNAASELLSWRQGVHAVGQAYANPAHSWPADPASLIRLIRHQRLCSRVSRNNAGNLGAG